MRTGLMLLVCVVALSVVAAIATPTLWADSPQEATVTVQDLPPGFLEMPEEDGAAGSAVPLETLSRFRFEDRANAYTVWGETDRLTPSEKGLVELLLDNPVSVLQLFPADPEFDPAMTSVTMLDTIALGDKSVAMFTQADSATQSETWPEFGSLKRTDVVVFMLDDRLAMLAFAYPESNPTRFVLEAVALKLQERMAAQAPNPEEEASQDAASAGTASIPEPPTATPAPTEPPPPTEPPAPTNTPTATNTPTPEPVPTEAQEWSMRSGPGVKYDKVATVHSGDNFEVLGQSGECAWLYVKTPKGAQGWVPGLAAGSQSTGDCEPLPICSMRPKTGMIGRYDLANGKGKLKVENGSDQDGIVILSDKSDNAKLAGYIRAGSNFTIGGIPDGSYRVFFATGDCWDDETRSFATNVRAVRMFELENYKTTSSTYTIWEITLHNVEGGEGIGAEVPDNELPVIP